VLVCALFCCAASALAKTYAPTRTDDPAPGKCKPGNCSLREAVNAANAHAGEDTIVLRRGATYKLTRVPSDLGFDDSVTVVTDGSRPATIDARGHGSIFVEPIGGEEPQLTLKRLVLTGATNGAIVGDVIRVTRSRLHGNEATNGSGGAISAGILFLNRSAVAENRAAFAGGGIYVDRGITMVGSKVFANHAATEGGGLLLGVPEQDNTSSMTIKTSTIAGNRAGGFGGGIYNLAEGVEVERTTIAKNRAGQGGGGLANVSVDFNDSFFFGSSITLGNSTIALNRARGFGGGIDSFDTTDPGDLVDPPFTRLESTTVAFNVANSDDAGAEQGGGIQNGGAGYSSHNTLVARNSVGTGGGAPDCNGSIGSDGTNLIGNAAGCVFDLDDLVGGAKLGTFGDYGGPTATVKLRKGSAAINSGDDADCPPIDQRGVKRRRCDIGAFERR
jgi:CSLREA domain-containing protein